MTVIVERLGNQGDGLATAPDSSNCAGARLFIAGALPGERVRVRLSRQLAEGFEARLISVDDAASTDRIEPPCPYFGRCGGCSVQHMSPAAYAAWKTGLVETALTRQGLDASVVQPIRVPEDGARRRIELAALKGSRGVILGFHAHNSHRIEPITDCLVASGPIRALLDRLPGALDSVLVERERADLLVMATQSGVSLVLTTRNDPPLDGRLAMTEFAEAHDLAGVYWRPGHRDQIEPIAERRRPDLAFGPVRASIPPAGFFQASAGAEALLRASVEGWLGDRPGDNAPGRVIDLFSGGGTFSLPLAASGWRVEAVDGERRAIEALKASAADNGLSDRLRAEVRDLTGDPPPPSVLNQYDAAIFDPPRAGGEAVARQIAGSRIARVIAVSCNPASFARDARLLIEGEYRLVEVRPIDQFRWSHHVELVALFERS